MSAHHFFLDNQVIASLTQEQFVLELNEEDARHAKVLRLQVGETISVVDADRDYFLLKIHDFQDGLPVCSITQKKQLEPASHELILVQGISKGEKMDSVMRGATEVGVDALVPLACARSVAKVDAAKSAKKMARWQGIVRSAAMQAGRTHIPTVYEPCDITQFSHMLTSEDLVLVFWEEASLDATIDAYVDAHREIMADCKRVYVVVGPEGGMEASEVEALQASEAQVAVLTLGPSILRTQTAGVVAPALVAHELRRGMVGAR